MTVTSGLRANYMSHRRHGMNARRALERAREELANGKSRFLDLKEWPTWNPLHEGKRWANSLANGLRMVGYADEVSRKCDSRAIDHTGWYDNPYGESSKDGSGLVRGIVFQLPGKAGKERYLAGYVAGGEDGALVEMDIIEGDNAGSSWSMGEAALDAARRADRLAELAAESEREYREAYDAGAKVAEARALIVANRAKRRALVREMREARRSGLTGWPSICEALRERMAAIREESWEANESIGEIDVAYLQRFHKDAFNEGLASA